MINIFENIVSDLSRNKSLDHFKLHKNESLFIINTQQRRNVVFLRHWKNIDSTKLIIFVIFGIHFYMVMKWSERFNFKSLRTQRELCTFYWTVDMLGGKINFEILLNYENYNSVLDKLQKFVSEFISTIFSKILHHQQYLIKL